MEEKSTLFEYLYRNLREQIMTGYLKYGDPLPSMSQDVYKRQVERRQLGNLGYAWGRDVYHLDQALQDRRCKAGSGGIQAKPKKPAQRTDGS